MAQNGDAQGTVKDRVLKFEVGLKSEEETIRQQGEVITVLREENKRLVSELQTFKGEIQSKVKGHVEKIKEDLQFKHAFIVVQNKQLQNPWMHLSLKKQRNWHRLAQMLRVCFRS